MQFVTRHRRKATINIISLVDVVFLLLIFFTVTATFMNQPSITIDLPPGGEKKERSIGETTPMTVTISRDAEFFFDEQPIRIDDLKRLLKEGLIKGRPNRLTIQADSAVVHGMVIRTMDIAQQAEIDSVDVITENLDR